MGKLFCAGKQQMSELCLMHHLCLLVDDKGKLDG